VSTKAGELHLPANEIAAWRAEDPLCEQYAYYNVLTNFAVARARTTGLEDTLPEEATAELVKTL
jgi:hypothetical protein